MVQDPVSIVNVPVPPNIFPFFTINVGKIRDTGFEFSLNYAMGSETGFMYKLNLSASYSLDNRPLSLQGTLNGTALDYGVKNVGNVGTPGNSGIPLVQVEEGKPFGQLITLAFKEFDEQGNMIFRDINYDRSIDQDDRIIAGNALPKSMIGIGNNLTYGKWDLNVLFRGVFGHDMVNIYRAGYESPGMISSYNLPRSATDEIAPERQVFRSSNDYCDLHIENASFLCLDNMSLGFTISPAVGKLIKKFRAYVAGNNLFYLTKYKGIDPNPRYGDTGDIGYDQLIPGIDRMNTWYRSKSITLGANINF
jgi:iron complex outermembrane receptor protein